MFPFKFSLALLFLFKTLFAVSQVDTVRVVNIYNKTNTLQFGNDYKYQQHIEFQSEIPKSFSNTEYFKYYNQKYLVYDPVKDPKRLVYNTGLFLGAAVASFGVLWIMPESFTSWDKEEMLEDGILSKWKDNVTSGPVWDEDGFFFNWISHPWAGAVYYMSARGSGYNKWESFAYSALMSTFLWEYGVEAFAETPSWQDLFITPILGSILGEQFFRWKGNIIKNEKKVLNSRFLGGTSLFLMDPFNQVLDGLGYKTKNKIQTYSIFAPIEYDFYANKTIWGMQVVMVF